MCHENSIEHTNKHETAEGYPPAASASEIINQDTPMSKMWPFVGGVFVGAAGVVAVALVADKLTYEGSGGADLIENTERQALPEGKQKS